MNIDDDDDYEKQICCSSCRYKPECRTNQTPCRFRHTCLEILPVDDRSRNNHFLYPNIEKRFDEYVYQNWTPKYIPLTILTDEDFEI